MTTQNEAYGRLAIDRAEEEWQQGVTETPGGFARIDQYIRGKDGLGWGSVEVGPGARPGIPYHANGCFQWCGAFAAWAWSTHIPPKIRRECFPSTVRLWEWAHGLRLPGTFAGKFQITDPGKPLAWPIMPGDILVIERGDGGRVWGDHITICRDPVGYSVLTVEGNATGVLPDGSRSEGVVHRERFLPGHQPAGTQAFIRWILRPAATPAA